MTLNTKIACSFSTTIIIMNISIQFYPLNNLHLSKTKQNKQTKQKKTQSSHFPCSHSTLNPYLNPRKGPLCILLEAPESCGMGLLSEISITMISSMILASIQATIKPPSMSRGIWLDIYIHFVL